MLLVSRNLIVSIRALTSAYLMNIPIVPKVKRVESSLKIIRRSSGESARAQPQSITRSRAHVQSNESHSQTHRTFFDFANEWSLES